MQGLRAKPDVGHISVHLLAQRQNYNDSSIRKLMQADVTLTASDPGQFAALDTSRFVVVNPEGVQARVRAYLLESGTKRFKAARAHLVFKLVEDSAGPTRSNVPAGYFNSDGPYRVQVNLPKETVSGSLSFGQPVALRVTQNGAGAQAFALQAAQPIELATAPAKFGPVYYKQQDALSALYQLANMSDALSKDADGHADFRAPAESPQYFFQLRLGPLGQEATQILDPAAYISGAKRGLIRADSAQTPIVLPAEGLNPHQTLVLEFARQETLPRERFYSAGDNVSIDAVTRERVVYSYELR